MGSITRHFTKALIPLLILGFAGFADAAAGAGGKHKGDHLAGKLVSVANDGSSITIKQRAHKGARANPAAAGAAAGGGQTVTIQTNASTSVTINGVSGKKVTDLTPGLIVIITPNSGVATSIIAKQFTPGQHKKKGAKPTAAADFESQFACAD